MPSQKEAAGRAPESAEDKNLPYGEERVGRSCITGWENEYEIEGEMKAIRHAVPSCLYVDGELEDGRPNWERGNSFGKEDAKNLVAAVKQFLFNHHGGGFSDAERAKLRPSVRLPREDNQPINIGMMAVNVAIWKQVNEESGETWYSMQPSCRYRKDGEMRNGSSFGYKEMEHLVAAMDEAVRQIEKREVPNQQVAETSGAVDKLVVERPNKKK